MFVLEYIRRQNGRRLPTNAHKWENAFKTSKIGKQLRPTYSNEHMHKIAQIAEQIDVEHVSTFPHQPVVCKILCKKNIIFHD